MILYDTENAVSNEIGISDQKHIRNGPCSVLIMVSMVELDWAPLRCISVYSGTVGCSGVCEWNGNCSVESTRDGLPLQDATICDLKLTRSYSKNRDIAEEEKEVCTT